MKVHVDNIISADHKIIRMINRANVLNLIREKSPISRVDISKITGLNKSTISNIVSELIDEGLVFEGHQGESAIGRKPITLSLNERSRIMGVIDIRLTDTTIAVCDIGGNVLEMRQFPTECGESNGIPFVNKCGDTLAEMFSSYKETKAGVGMSIPGLVDSNRGFFYLPKSIGWKNIPIRTMLEEKVGCNVIVSNDAASGACAELWFAEEARNLSNFVFIWVCEGIGVGMVMNRSLYRGYSSLEGHFGGQIIKVDGKWEEISSNNTWEDNASNTGVVNRYYDSMNSTPTNKTEAEMQKIVDLAKEGNANAVRALKETARYLGVGLANINNGLGPERIILSGKILQVWDIVFPEIITQMQNLSIYDVIPVEKLVIPTSLKSSPFDGAKALVISEVFGGYNIV